MASRKPLVLISGQLQEIPSGDTLNATVTDAGQFQLTNANAGAIVIGSPVYASAAGSVDLARANASGTEKAIGLVSATSISASASGTIQTDGILTATTTQWDAVAGTTGGLTAGATYYLSAATAGRITATAPSTGGQYVRTIGVALSTTDLLVRIQPSVLLA